MDKITIHAKLVDYNIDLDGYITYVFFNLEYTDWTNKYIMCIRYPNWDQAPFKLGDKGYLTYIEVIAGLDTWYDRNLNQQVPYNYTNIQFIKFIHETTDKQQKDILL